MGIVTAKFYLFTKLSFGGDSFIYSPNSLLVGILFFSAWAFYWVAGMTIAHRTAGFAGESAKRVTRARSANMSAKLESNTLLMLFQQFFC